MLQEITSKPQPAGPHHPPTSAQLTAHFLPSIAAVDRRAWDRVFGDASEGFDYYLACERSPPSMFEFSAIGVCNGETLVAGAPVFRTDFRLDMMLEGRSRKLADWVGRRFPRLVTIPVMGIGSPHSDDLSFAFDPTLAVPNSEEAYIDSLSANMRSNIRRKMKRAKEVCVEVRSSVDGVEEAIFALREATRRRAMTDYDVFAEVSPTYFRQVLSHLGERAKLLLYWRGDDLIGFALVLIEPTRLIEKYNGMRYPDGPDHGVFFRNWMTQVRLCVEGGIPELHAGETTYLTKARLGCKLHRSWIYFRHRHRPINQIFGLLSRWIAFDSTDPDLRKLGTDAPYVEPVLEVDRP